MSRTSAAHLAEVVHGHSTNDMLVELSRSLKVPSPLLDAAKALDRHYIPARYPNAHPSGAPFQHYTKREAQRAVQYADKIDRFCQSHIP